MTNVETIKLYAGHSQSDMCLAKRTFAHEQNTHTHTNRSTSYQEIDGNA